ncbi:MAG: hypothetical protein QOJ03_1007 [Frankiaceae bacterium]|nr:hypothetical protein [Frankiaceae bacterium]
MTGRARLAAHGGLATFAASSALGAVFDGFGWLFPVLGAIAVVVIVSELVRWSPLPSGLGPLAAAAGVTLYVTWAYARDAAYGQVLPGSAALRVLGDTARDGFHDIRTLATPVPTHRGLVLIAVVGIAAVALVVDLLAVTMRRAALAGLPLLAVFAMATSVSKHGAGWVPFVLGTAGYLWLLLADSRDRLSRWGRPLGFDRDGRPHFTWSDQDVMPSPLSVMGRRIGVTAIAIGVVLPLLIPGLRGGVPHGGGHGLGFGGSGSSRAFTVNPIVEIRAQLTSARSQPVLTMRTTDPSPGYLRLTALDEFDGTRFTPSTLEAAAEAQVSRGIDAPAVDGPTNVTNVDVQSLDVHWLPVPTQVVSVEVAGDWRYDRDANTVFSARADTRGLSYTAQSVRPDPTPAALRQASAADPSVAPFLALPRSIAPDVTDLTARVTAAAVTPFDKAVAIQRFLTSSPFVYDISVQNPDSTDALENFLLHSHRGFCQQFASAMAVMARIANIPSRVAVGFTRGEPQPDGSWLVTTHDAHAWPELYFSGFGWLAFEPTPRGDGQAVKPDYTIVNSPTEPGTTGKDGKTGPGGKARNNPGGVSKNDRLDALADANGGAAATGSGAATGPPTHGGRRILAWVGLGLLAVLLVAPSIARVVSRRRRWRHAHTPAELAAAAWAELRASAIDARAGWIEGLTPRATVRVLRAEAPGLATAEVRALDRLVDAVQRAWYSSSRTPVDGNGLQDDVETIRAAFLSDATVTERFVLRAWPRSTLQAARDGFGHIGELLDLADLTAARLRARVARRTARAT